MEKSSAWSLAYGGKIGSWRAEKFLLPALANVFVVLLGEILMFAIVVLLARISVGYDGHGQSKNRTRGQRARVF